MAYHTQYTNYENFDFSAISYSEAQDQLKSFLNRYNIILENLKIDLKLYQFKYTYDELEYIFNYIGERLEATKRNKEENVPEYIKNTKSYKDGLFDFNIHSLEMIFCFAFYIGEFFCHHNNKINWDIGNKDFIQCNKPVIKGFRVNNMEMEVIRISHNLFRSYYRGEKDRLIKFFNTWKSYE